MTNAPQQQTIDTSTWLRLLHENRFADLCRQMIAVIQLHGDRTQASLDAAARQKLNDLLNLFFFIVAFPSFQVPDDLAAPFIQINRTLSNLAAMSGFKNTDPYLESIKLQPNNLVRMLALYSARNTIRLDMQIPFQVNPYLASLWYVQVAQAFQAGLASETVFRNLQEHFAAAPEKLLPVSGMREIFFGAASINPNTARAAKDA